MARKRRVTGWDSGVEEAVKKSPAPKRGPLRATAKSDLLRCEIVLEQEIRSDRKDAKAVIHDTLDPRDYAPHPGGAPLAGPTRCVVKKRSRRFFPGGGTLSSSDRIPCYLSFIIAS
jgi:hypothetical protein